MKTVFILCILLSSFKFASSQTEYDFLKKYTYLIVTYKTHINLQSFTFSKPISVFDPIKSLSISESLNSNNFRFDTVITGLASGFFIRMKKRLFFVGSYHVFMGVDTYKKQLIDNLNKTEILGIEYYDSVTKTYRYYHINIQNLNPNQEVVSLNEYPDVYIYEIREELPQEMEIYSIEDFLPKKKSKKLKDSISYSIVYGFFNEKPFQRLTLLSTLYMDPNYMRLHPYLGALATQDECLNFLPNVDSLNLRLKTFNKWGASGAPVFFKVRNKKKERFEFAGVQCAGNPYFDCSIIVKAREVINLLNRVSRN